MWQSVVGKYGGDSGGNKMARDVQINYAEHGRMWWRFTIQLRNACETYIILLVPSQNMV